MAGESIRVFRGQTMKLLIDLFEGKEAGPRLDITGGDIFWSRYTLPTKVELFISDAPGGVAGFNFREVDTKAMVSGKVYPLEITLRLADSTIVFPSFSISVA